MQHPLIVVSTSTSSAAGARGVTARATPLVVVSTSTSSAAGARGVTARATPLVVVSTSTSSAAASALERQVGAIGSVCVSVSV